METITVICPSCYEGFEVVVPPINETPCEVDYDCEVCCRPMVIEFTPDDSSEVTAFARSLDD